MRSLLWLLFLELIYVTLAHQGHGHEASTGPPPTSFNDPKITQDQEHLKEHMKDEMNVNENLTPEQMEFHYFRIHDVNNDTFLDGLEIMAAVSHMMPEPELTLVEKLGKTDEQKEAMLKERHAGFQKYLEDLIDAVLRNDDLDQNGYLSYAEYIRARRRDAYHQRKMMEQQAMQQQQAQQQQQFQQFQEYMQQQEKEKQRKQQQGQQQGQQQQGQQLQYQPTVPVTN